MPIECAEILNDGEGEADKPIRVDRPSLVADAAEFAEAAARILDEREMRNESDLDDSDFCGSSRVIEVRGLAGDAGPRRFRVRCEVRRFYTAGPEGA